MSNFVNVTSNVLQFVAINCNEVLSFSELLVLRVPGRTLFTKKCYLGLILIKLIYLNLNDLDGIKTKDAAVYFNN